MNHLGHENGEVLFNRGYCLNFPLEQHHKTPIHDVFILASIEAWGIGQAILSRKDSISCIPIPLNTQLDIPSPNESNARLYVRRVQHDADGLAEALGWEVIAELCSYDAVVA